MGVQCIQKPTLMPSSVKYTLSLRGGGDGANGTLGVLRTLLTFNS